MPDRTRASRPAQRAVAEHRAARDDDHESGGASRARACSVRPLASYSSVAEQPTPGSASTPCRGLARRGRRGDLPMPTRAELEAREATALAPWAMRSRDSRGRRHPEPEHPLRMAFQRDRDRIIHSTAFRRLEYKTQVFVNQDVDYYRTRLTSPVGAAHVTRQLARTP